VALSGDGGDEICAGYNRYFLLNKLHYVYNYCPKLIRQATCSLIRGIRTEHWDKLLNIPLVQNKGITGGKLHKLAHILSHESKAQIYPHLITQWQDSKLPLAAYQGSDVLEEYVAKNISTISDMQKADMTGYLPGDILTKVDRASMAFSLEARVPLLDHRVVELAFSLPTEFHLHKGQTKSILREVLYKHVPRKLIERPKMGFGAPIGEWLKGDLREWAGDLLSSERLRREGVFNPEAIETKWKEHSSGKQNWQYALWNILMFQAWSEHYE
jgi:asparagine synthase (glutamine-hydrolysing)